jgi:alkylation response protein AidB-like acyl-CoA dehydrogenase
MNVGRLSVAARALGLARECLAVSERWTRSRRGLSKNASVAERLARLRELAARLSAASAKTAALADSGADVRRESALAKLFAASAAFEAADVALQLRGGRGYETAASQRAGGERPEPVERFLRDARGLRLIEGADDSLRAALARRIMASERRGAGEPTAAAYARADEAVRLYGENLGRGGRS